MNASPPSHISAFIPEVQVSVIRQFKLHINSLTDSLSWNIFFSMSGPNSSSEWSIEGRRLVPLLPRLVPQTAFTVTANAVASATANQNASLPLPAETGNKEGWSWDCSSVTEQLLKQIRTTKPDL